LIGVIRVIRVIRVGLAWSVDGWAGTPSVPVGNA
jgi:hypothetical protein